MWSGFRRLEEFANRLTDQNWGWWPFQFLRPDRAQRMTTLHVAKMSLFYGPIGGLLAFGGVTILGVAPLNLECGRWPLCQEK